MSRDDVSLVVLSAATVGCGIWAVVKVADTLRAFIGDHGSGVGTISAGFLDIHLLSFIVALVLSFFSAAFASVLIRAPR